MRKKASRNLEKQNTLREDNSDVMYDLTHSINLIIHRWDRCRVNLRNFLPIIDQFISSSEHFLGKYEFISSRFGFLRKLDVLSSQEILTTASNLVVVYNDDLDVCLGNELVEFVEFVNAFMDEQDEGVSLEFHVSTDL